MLGKVTGSIVAFVPGASQAGGLQGVLPPAMRWWVFGAVVGITLLGVMIFSPIAFPVAFAVLASLWCVPRSAQRWVAVLSSRPVCGSSISYVRPPKDAMRWVTARGEAVTYTEYPSRR